jgi:hypothetical protein
MNGRIHIYREGAYGYLKRTPLPQQWYLFDVNDRFHCRIKGSAAEARKRAKKIIDKNRDRFTERTS